MAIVEMKRIDLLAMRQDQRKLLRTLQDMGCVEITPLQDEALAEYRTRDDGRLEQVDALLARLSWVIHECAAYNYQPAPFMGNLPEASAQDVHYITQQEAALQETLRQAETLEKRSGEYRGQLMRLQVAQSQLKPWLSFDLPMEQMHNTRRVAHFLGTVKAAELQQCQEKWASLPVVVEQLSAEHDTAAVWICAHQSARGQVAADLRDAGFAPAQLPEFTGTAAEQSARLENEKNEILRQQEALVQDWKALSAELTHLKVWYDALTIERDQLEAARQTIGTGKAFLLRGWVPAEVAQQVADKCRSLAPTCSVDITDPAEGDEPPVLLDNNRVNAPYESVVEGFALPAYRSVDPTAVMAPFYACLFGMMLSDAGYGLVMIVGILALIFLKKPAKKNARLLWVLFGGAVMTVVWGAAYNTWMGFTAPWGGLLDPMNDPMPVMMICLAVGVIHLYAGLGMAGCTLRPVLVDFRTDRSWAVRAVQRYIEDDWAGLDHLRRGAAAPLRRTREEESVCASAGRFEPDLRRDELDFRHSVLHAPVRHGSGDGRHGAGHRHAGRHDFPERPDWLDSRLGAVRRRARVQPWHQRLGRVCSCLPLAVY